MRSLRYWQHPLDPSIWVVDLLVDGHWAGTMNVDRKPPRAQEGATVIVPVT